MVVSEPKNRGSPSNKGHPLVPTQPQEWTKIPDLCHPRNQIRRSSSFTTTLHLGSGESGVEDLNSDTQRTGWKLIGIGTRDQSLQLGVFGVSCLLACDILVKYCDRPQPYKGCGFY